MPLAIKKRITDITVRIVIDYRIATEEDNRQLIELTAESGMDGEIALRIDRNPDFFSLLKLRGESTVIVAIEDQKIIGSLSVSIQDVFIDGQLCPVNYVGDFKVLESYRKRGVGMNLLNFLAEKLYSSGKDLVFLNIAKGNQKPVSFSTNKKNYPDFVNVGTFNVYQFIGKKRTSSQLECKIEQSENTEEVRAFFAENYKKYELGVHIVKEKLDGTEIFIIRENNSIIGAISLMDTMSVKQNIVIRVSWKLNLILKVMNAIGPFLGLSKMPLFREPVQMIYIKYLALKSKDKRVMKMLIDHARFVAFEKSYSFVSIGLHDKDPLTELLSGMIKFIFKSNGLITSLKGNVSYLEKVKNGIPYEDFSLV